MKRKLLAAITIVTVAYIAYKVYCCHFDRMWDRFIEELFRKAIG